MMTTEAANSLVLVVSLESAIERRAAFTASAAGAKLPWKFFDAHTDADPVLINDTAEQRRWSNRELMPGEIGCYSSHVGTWRQLLESNAKQMFVFEDDVVIDWPYIEHLAQIDFGAANIDMLSLFAKMPSPYRDVERPYITPYFHLIQYLHFKLGTQAYIVTRTGAQRLMDACSTIRRPIDVEMDRSWAHGLPNLAIQPSPVFERFQPSSIGDSRLGSANVRRQITVGKLIERFRRAVYRLSSKPRVISPPPRFLRNPPI